MSECSDLGPYPTGGRPPEWRRGIGRRRPHLASLTAPPVAGVRGGTRHARPQFQGEGGWQLRPPGAGLDLAPIIGRTGN